MRHFFLTLFILFLVIPRAGGTEIKGIKPAPKDKCPVCGMFVAKYPDFLAAILFKDGSKAFFDGPKDMFKYYLDMKKYNAGKKWGDIETIYVTDYYTLTLLNALQAWYVLGSDIYGPMGRELIPLGKEAEARDFQKDHKGQRILKFQEVNLGLVKGLD